MNDPQPALFDRDQTVDNPCPVPGCQAIRLPGQQPPIATCAHDLGTEPARRPRNCLNRILPGDLPEGY